MILASNKIAYQAIPKNACTSIKSGLYRLESGVEFLGNRYASSVHVSFPTTILPAWPEGYFSFCVVRNPVERFASLIRNRIIHYRDLRNLETRIFASKPIISEMLESYEASGDESDIYHLLSDIVDIVIDNFDFAMINSSLFEHHALPQMYWINYRLDALTNIYCINSFDKLNYDIEQFSHRAIEFRREQTEGPKIPVECFSFKSRKKIEHIYGEDIKKLEKFYSP